MAKKEKTKFITPDIMKSSIIGAFQKLDPRYMIKNPVMFVVELGFFITLVLTIFQTLRNLWQRDVEKHRQQL